MRRVKTLLALRHVVFEDLGSFELPFAQAGYAIRYVDASTADFEVLAKQPWELLVVLGGPIGVNDAYDYPFITGELKFIETRLRREQPTLGICLGSQFMAAALGARVYRGKTTEIGWQPLTFTAAGRSSALRQLTGPVLHWHAETFDLPMAAVHLAATDGCAHQAFSWGKSALALQFHAEVTARGLEQWYVGHSGELRSHGLAPAVLRAQTARHAELLRGQAAAFLYAWLAGLTPLSAGLDMDVGADLDV